MFIVAHSSALLARLFETDQVQLVSFVTKMVTRHFYNTDSIGEDWHRNMGKRVLKTI